MKRTTATKTERIEVYSELARRLNIASKLGIQYSGNRDVYQALGYPKELKYLDYRARYERQDIAAAVIDRPCDATWRGTLLIEESTDKDTALEQAWKDLYTDLSLKSVFSRVDKLAAIGRYAVLFLGYGDATTLADLQKEVSGTTNKLLYVKPFSELQATIANLETSPKSPRFGKPKFYQIVISETSTAMVHYSRVLHIVPRILDDEVYGIPAMQRVYNRLIDLEKIVGGSGEMFWRGARPGYQGEVAPEYQFGDTEMQKLQTRIDEYEHNLRRVLINEGVKFSALEAQVSDPKPHVDVQVQMVSAGTNIPVRILLGSERGELASTQDRENWYDYISIRRQEHAEPSILSPFVKKCMETGALPSTEQEWKFRWEELYSISDKEKAEIGKTRASALKEYVSTLGAEAVIPEDYFLLYLLGFDE